MDHKPKPLTPPALTIAQALDGSAPLARLRAALEDARARYRVIEPALPSGLRAHVKPGALDDDGWALLAANPSVAAKLRQLIPRMEALLLQQGHGATKIRIKIL